MEDTLDGSSPPFPGADAPVPPGYRLLSRIGEGGMGAVYRAVDDRLDREVAIKYLVVTDPHYRERFRREANILSRLRHPGIVTLYKDEVVGERPLLICEYVDGHDLRHELVTRGPFDVDRAIHVMREMLVALRYAHREGVIHRDLKTENVLLTRDGRVKIADFGVASCRDLVAEATRTGVILGTPAYMAPEQTEGRRVDARADLYSAGIILFEMLSGRLPFDDPSPLEVLRQQRCRPPPRLDEIRPGIPPGIAAMVDRCLAKDPLDRPADAGAMMEELLASHTAGSPQDRPGGMTPARSLPPHGKGRQTETLDVTCVTQRPRGRLPRGLFLVPVVLLGVGLLLRPRSTAAVIVIPEAAPRISRARDGIVVDPGFPAHVLIEATVRAPAPSIRLERVEGRNLYLLPSTMFARELEVELTAADGSPLSPGRIHWDLSAGELTFLRRFHAEIFGGLTARERWDRIPVEAPHHRRPMARGLVLALARSVSSRETIRSLEAELGGETGRRPEALGDLARDARDRLGAHLPFAGMILEQEDRFPPGTGRMIYECLLPVRILQALLASLPGDPPSIDASVVSTGSWTCGAPTGPGNVVLSEHYPTGAEDLTYWLEGALSHESALSTSPTEMAGLISEDGPGFRIVPRLDLSLTIPGSPGRHPPLEIELETYVHPCEEVYLAPTSMIWMAVGKDHILLLGHDCVQALPSPDRTAHRFLTHAIPSPAIGPGRQVALSFELDWIPPFDRGTPRPNNLVTVDRVRLREGASGR